MKEKYIEDLKEIKDIMNRSSRFISLSGWSGISAGVIGLLGATAAHKMVLHDINLEKFNLSGPDVTTLIAISLGTLVLAVAAAIYFTSRETKKRGVKSWDHNSRKLLSSLSIPLVTGGLVCLVLLNKGHAGLIPGMMLTFYGLALVNAGKFTLDLVRSLGILEIFLGLIAIAVQEYSLILWAIGFGVLHILSGLIIQRKYKS